MSAGTGFRSHQGLAFLLVQCAIIACLAGTADAAAPKPILIVYPNGGEVFAPGQTQRVQLSDKTVARQIRIDLSRDGGATFTPLGTIQNPRRKAGVFPGLEWEVDLPAMTQGVIRAVSLDAARPGEGQSNPFSVAELDVSESGLYVLRSGDAMTGALHLPEDGLAVGTTQLVVNGDTTNPAAVGIGTAEPEHALDVRGEVSANRVQLRNGANANLSTVQPSEVTAPRTYTLPDASGEIAVVLRATANLNYDVVGSADHADSTTIAVAGAVVGDAVVATPHALPSPWGRFVWMAYVSAPDTVVIRVRNTSAFDTDPDGVDGSTWAVRVIK